MAMEKAQAVEKVVKLIALYHGTNFPGEKEAAKRQALKLSEKFSITRAEVKAARGESVSRPRASRAYQNSHYDNPFDRQHEQYNYYKTWDDYRRQREAYRRMHEELVARRRRWEELDRKRREEIRKFWEERERAREEAHRQVEKFYNVLASVLLGGLMLSLVAILTTTL